MYLAEQTNATDAAVWIDGHANMADRADIVECVVKIVLLVHLQLRLGQQCLPLG